MWAVRARLSAIAATIALFSFADRPAFARGSQVGHDDPANSERIERLPPDLRNAVIHMCGDPRAGHINPPADTLVGPFGLLGCEKPDLTSGIPLCK